MSEAKMKYVGCLMASHAFVGMVLSTNNYVVLAAVSIFLLGVVMVAIVVTAEA